MELGVEGKEGLSTDAKDYWSHYAEHYKDLPLSLSGTFTEMLPRSMLK
jgi:hypothetical protein